jgi:hypothetical protein
MGMQRKRGHLKSSKKSLYTADYMARNLTKHMFKMNDGQHDFVACTSIICICTCIFIRVCICICKGKYILYKTYVRIHT